jgi:tripartite-type tricarboxylate transporter receptor subunit TctC
MAPAGTPSAVISRLQDELSKILVNKDVKNRLFNLNVVPTSSTSEELNKLIYSEISMWRQVALDNNIKAE